MGKGTPSPEQTREDLPNTETSSTSGCPLDAKGDIKIVVKLDHDKSAVKGASVSLSGTASKSGKTNGSGEVLFKKLRSGAYTYTVDIAHLKLKWPAEEIVQSGGGVTKNKVTTYTVLIKQYGAVRVEVWERDGASDVALVPNENVVRVFGGPVTQEGGAVAEFDKIPAGMYNVDAELTDPEWVLHEDNDDLSIQIRPGETTLKKILAKQHTWLGVSIHDQDKGMSPKTGRVYAKVPGINGDVGYGWDKRKALKKYFDKSKGTTFKVKRIEIDADDDDDVFEFVSIE